MSIASCIGYVQDLPRRLRRAVIYLGCCYAYVQDLLHRGRCRLRAPTIAMQIPQAKAVARHLSVGAPTPADVTKTARGSAVGLMAVVDVDGAHERRVGRCRLVGP